MPWSRRQSLNLIKKLEPRLAAIGWHVALAGSVLTKGQSDKDLDLIVYPHCSEEIDFSAIDVVFQDLKWRQIRTTEQMHRHWRKIGSLDEKYVTVRWVNSDPDLRVDIIYPGAFST